MTTSDSRKGMHLTRKAFLRGMGVMGGAFALGGTGFWANSALAQGAPRKGGVMNVNLSGDPSSFDSLSSTSSLTMLIIGPCYNGLVRFDPDDPEAIIPDLALGWEISEDGKTYTFPLVQGVKFHDGVPMTSADAKYTFETVKNPADGMISSRMKLMDVVDSIETPDDHTIVFQLKSPSPGFLANLASCWMLVLPKHILEAEGAMKENIVGTGPFKIANINRGVSYTLERNPDYHIPEKPYLDGITYYVIPDSGTTWSYLQNGQIQLFYSIQGQDAGAFKSGGKVKVLETPATSFIGAVYNANKAPFDNVVLRQALSLAIDRQAALEVTYNGQGELGGITVPGKWAMSSEALAEVPGYGPDGSANREEAKRLLAEAGYPDGFDLTVTVRKNPLFEPVGVFLKDQWDRIGVRVTLDIKESAAYREAINTGDFLVSASGGSFAITDPDAVFGDESICGGAPAAACDGKMLDLFRQQSTEIDPAKRLELVHELELEALKQYGVYMMYWRNRFMGQSVKLHGLEIHPNIDQNMRMDGVWLEA